MLQKNPVLESVSESRAGLEQCLIEFLDLRIGKENSRIRASINLLLEKLQKFSFNLVVLGEFKRGKSSLINALLGAPVLPTGVIPLTSIPTVIGFAEVAKLQVKFIDGRVEQSSIDALENYVTERLNPNNGLDVLAVEVSYPAELLRQQVNIVDTPGTGSVHLHNTKAAYEFLPDADAAIFVLSADQPASLSELQFLADARGQIQKFFFVQNKVDLLSAEELEESNQFLTKTLSAHCKTACTVYPVSARSALQAKLTTEALTESTTFTKFELDITSFLVNQKGVTFISNLVTRSTRICDDATQLLNLELSANERSIESLQENFERFRAAAREIIAQESDAQFIVRGESHRLVQAIETNMNPIVFAKSDEIEGSLQACFDENKHLRKDDLINALRQKLREQIELSFSQWRREEESLLGNAFSKITERFVERSNRIVAEISQASRQLFDMEIKTHFELEPLTSDSRHYYVVDDPFVVSLQMLPLLLPDPIAKFIIRKKFIGAVKLELSRNAGRLRADLQERIEKSTNKFLANFNGQIRASLSEIESTVDRAVSRKREGSEAVQISSARLQQEISEIEGLKISMARHLTAFPKASN